MRNYLFFLLAGLTMSSFSLQAQWQTGWALDPHAGINSALIQPAATASVPYDWDVNLVQVSGFFTNDYAFLRQASALRLLNDFRGGEEVEVLETGFEWAIGDSRYAYDYLGNGKPHSGRGGIDIMGPSFSIQLGQSSRIGAFSRIRGLFSSRNIDADFSYYPYDNAPFGSSLEVNEFYVAAALWNEFGLNFSQAIPVGTDAEIRIGGNFRYLVAVDGVSAYNPDGTTFGKISLDSVSLINAQTEIAFTNGLRGTPDEGTTSGNGFAGDLGIQYAWESLDQGGYKFVAGLSILDLGQLTFNKTAELHRFSNPGEVIIFAEDYEFADGREDVDAVIRQLDQVFFGGTGNSLIAEEFSIGLPTTISAQFSYQPIRPLRFSLAYLGDLPTKVQAFSQGEQVTLTAHYSRWWFGAGLTTSLYNWQFPNAGIQLRLGPVILGTDRLFGSVLTHPRLKGGDFYIGLKIHDFGGRKRGKKGGGQFSKRGTRGREVRCYEF